VSKQENTIILNEYVKTTGYHRKHAIAVVLAADAHPFGKPWVRRDAPSGLLEMKRTDGVLAEESKISQQESAYSADSQALIMMIFITKMPPRDLESLSPVWE
jgi:hypothetical protein